MQHRTTLLVALAVVALGGTCGASLAWAEDWRTDGHSADVQKGGSRGALFVMTDSTDRVRGNEIAMYGRDAQGELQFIGYFPTGRLSAGKPQLGAGPAPTAQVLQVAAGLPLVVASADGVGSSNSLLLSADNRCLFAVNAGSHTVSAFRVGQHSLTLVSVTDSLGVFPVSLTVYGNLLYVLNSGVEGSLAGFNIAESCRMIPLEDSRRDLADLTDSFPTPPPGEVLTTPAQASFTPDGTRLVLSIKGGDAQVNENGKLVALPSGRMAVFPVRANGQLRAPIVTAFSTPEGTGGPFSFVFANRRTIVVVHANSGTIASYTINDDNSLSLIDAPLTVGPFAPCWIVKSGRFVYVASFGAPSGVREILGEGPGQRDRNGTITGFRLNQQGAPRDLPGVEVSYPAPGAGRSGNHGIDMHIIGDFLYFTQPRTGKVGRLTIGADGSLTNLMNFGGLAPGLEPFVELNPDIHHFLERCFLQDPAQLSPECLLGSAQGITGF